jgi:hypothetical protein
MLPIAEPAKFLLGKRIPKAAPGRGARVLPQAFSVLGFRSRGSEHHHTGLMALGNLIPIGLSQFALQQVWRYELLPITPTCKTR